MNESVFNTLSKIILRTKEKKYSHKINGRWENQFIDMIHVPDVNKILNAACCEGKKIMNQSLVIPHKELGFSRNEFWFNVAKPGDSTGWHNHKEKATLSGVYYIKIPKKSGDIFFRKKRNDLWVKWAVKSLAGKMLLFDSRLEHSVEMNKSNNIRISLAFNLYTLPVMIDNQVEEYSSNKFYS